MSTVWQCGICYQCVTNKVGVTRCGNWWCHPQKHWQPFCRPLKSEKWWLFSYRLVATPNLSAFQHRLFSVNSAAKILISIRCHPMDGVTRGGPHHAPSDATPSAFRPFTMFTELTSRFYHAAEYRRGLAMRIIILSVCLSVRLSACQSNVWIVTKRKIILSRFLYHTKDDLA